MKSALIYGSCTGRTWHVAEIVVEALKPEIELEFIDVNKVGASDLNNWDFIICAIPTWDVGELEYGWSDVYDDLDGVELTNTVAMIGVGDQCSYADTYQDAMGILYKKLLECGANGGVAFTSTETHEFEESLGVIDGKFCGLAIDEDTQDDLTEPRIKEWAELLKKEWPAIVERHEQSVG